MKPLPDALLTLLQTLPEETCRITLNTNRQGHWEIEAVSRLKFDEERLPAPDDAVRRGTAAFTLVTEQGHVVARSPAELRMLSRKPY